MQRPSLPLTDDELARVKELLNQAKSTGPDDYDCYVVEFQDGARAEVFASDLSSGFMVAVRSAFSPMFLDFLFQMLKAGNMLMCPAMEDAMIIGTNENSFAEAPVGLLEQVVCHSPEQLGVLLSKGLNDWKRYRDQVVEG